MKAVWSPGAWTPKRCALWRSFDRPMKDRLEKWVWAEQMQAYPHKTQLPKGYEGESECQTLAA